MNGCICTQSTGDWGNISLRHTLEVVLHVQKLGLCYAITATRILLVGPIYF
jgi:hypothetical protein